MTDRLRPAILFRRASIAAALLVATAACADVATGPGAVPASASPSSPLAAAAAQPGSTTPTLLGVSGLARSAPLAQNVVYRFTITPSAGTFAMPGTGLRIVVPAGAITTSSLAVRVSARGGSMVAYDFLPHGTVFARPLQLQQDVASTALPGLANPTVEAGYFANSTQLDPANNRARVDEVLPVRLDAARTTLTFNVAHFSGYMLSSGRR
jgi:hypothetical protein